MYAVKLLILVSYYPFKVFLCVPRFWILVIDNDKVVVVFYYPSLWIRLGLFDVDNQAIAWIHALECPCSLLLYACCASGGYGRGLCFLGPRHEFCDCTVSYGLCGGKVARDDSVHAFGLFCEAGSTPGWAWFGGSVPAISSAVIAS